MKVTVDRRNWARGHEQDNYLLGENGMCCIGFVARALGFRANEIRGLQTLDDLPPGNSHVRPFPTNDMGLVADTLELAYSLNDSDMSDDERERRIQAELAKINIDMRFIH